MGILNSIGVEQLSFKTLYHSHQMSKPIHIQLKYELCYTNQIRLIIGVLKIL